MNPKRPATNTYFNLCPSPNERLRGELIGHSEEHEIIRCPNGHLARYRRVNDLIIKVKHNNQGERMIWSWTGECVVQEELLSEFRCNDLTGYRARSATVVFADGTPVRNYRELIVTGWAGVASPESGIRVIKRCPKCLW